jgi:NAD(P)-dependent dehydrogenase (short-subunit alcohol dehydrogenase family)
MMIINFKVRECGHSCIINFFATTHTAAMGARKNLSQSLNHELGPQGIHVVHVCLDGPVASPETIGLLMPKMYEKMMESKKPNDEMILPENVAETYWYLYSQPRSNWTLDLDIRPWKENPWMNSA